MPNPSLTGIVLFRKHENPSRTQGKYGALKFKTPETIRTQETKDYPKSSFERLDFSVPKHKPS
jgi:hypothetical protein